MADSLIRRIRLTDILASLTRIVSDYPAPTEEWRHVSFVYKIKNDPTAEGMTIWIDDLSDVPAAVVSSEGQEARQETS